MKNLFLVLYFILFPFINNAMENELLQSQKRILFMMKNFFLCLNIIY